MKPNIAPTSPKYQLDHPIEELYAKGGPAFEQPKTYRIGWRMIILTAVVGLVFGVLGVLGVNKLAHRWPTWSLWQVLSWPTGSSPEREVIIRETASVDRQDAERQEVYTRVSATLVSVFRSPDSAADAAFAERRFSADAYRGTGLLVTEDGIVAIDASQLNEEGASYVAVDHEGTVHSLTLLARDPLSSLGFARIRGEKFPVASFAVEADLGNGEPMYELSVNTQSGPAVMGQRTVTNLRSRPNSDRGSVEQSDALTRFVEVEGGSSLVPGAVLVERRGAVVGLRLATLPSNMAFPVALLRTALQSFTLHQEIERVRFGVTGYDLSLHPALQSDVSASPALGFFIAGDQGSVASGSPAEKAGLQAGDRIVSVNRIDLTAGVNLGELVQSLEIGATVPVRFIRDGAEMSADVTLSKIQ